MHADCLIRVPEVLPGLCPFPSAEIPHPDSVPADWVLGLTVNHLMSEDEEFRVEMRQVIHTCDVQWHRRVVD